MRIIMGGKGNGKKTFIVSCVFCVIVFGLWWWYVFGTAGNDIPNNTGGIDEARRDIQSVVDKQSEVIERLASVEEGLGRSASTVGTVSEGLNSSTTRLTEMEGRLSDSENRVTDSERLITEGKSIVKTVRERAEKN